MRKIAVITGFIGVVALIAPLSLFADFGSGYTDSDYTVWKFHPGMSDDSDDE